MTVNAALVALAALCWGLTGGIAAMLIADGWDPIAVSFYRGAIGFLFVFAWALLRPSGSGLGSPRLWCWSAIAGLGVAGNFAFYFVSIAQGSVAVAVTLMYSAPVIVYLVSFVFRLEHPTPLKMIAIALVLLGIVLLTRVYNTSYSSITLLGVAAGLLAGVSYALFIFGFKYAAAYGSPQAVLTIAFATVSATLFWPAGMHQAIAVPAAQDLPLLLSVGVFGAGLSFALYVTGLKAIAPTLAAILAMIEPVSASLFAFLVLDQSLAASQIVGALLVLFTVTLLSLRSAQEHV